MGVIHGVDRRPHYLFLFFKIYEERKVRVAEWSALLIDKREDPGSIPAQV